MILFLKEVIFNQNFILKTQNHKIKFVIFSFKFYLCTTNYNNDMIYPRKYSDKIISLYKNFPVVGLIGSRQSGKTTLVKLLKKQFIEPVIYLDLELPSDLFRLNDAELFLKQHLSHTIVIDEIQRKPELFPVIRAIIDNDNFSGKFIILGSASPTLLKQTSESLAGRIAYLEISPFSISELPEQISLYKHLLLGGYPKALFSTDDESAMLWIENFIVTYIERDIPFMGIANNPNLLYRLWTMLANLSGCILNYHLLSKSLGISVPTVTKYIDFFEHAYLLRRLYPYHDSAIKRLVKSPKVFMYDSGVMHKLLSINNLESLLGNPLLGNSWETYCVSQIINEMPSKYKAFYYRTHDGAECDLVLMEANKPAIAIEIKYASQPNLTRGNFEAMSAIGAQQNFIITPESDSLMLKKDIRVCNIFTFINTYLKK